MNDAEPLVGEVEGYRAFDVFGNSLWSVGYKPYQWLPGSNQAYCDRVRDVSSKRKVWVNDASSPTLLQRQREIESAHGRIPSPHCTCGFWFYKSEANCRDHFPELSESPSTTSFGDFGTDAPFSVMGRVRAWGRAIEGTDGYRSEYAKIIGLVVEEPDGVAAILDRYGLDATPMRSKAEQGLSTAWITGMTEGEPVTIKLNHPDPSNTDDEIGPFSVESGIAVPSIGSLVTVRFEQRGISRWITGFKVHEDDEEVP